MAFHSFFRWVGLAACLALGACATTDTQVHYRTQAEGMSHHTPLSLDAAEQSYSKKSDDPLTALNYAEALNIAGDTERAALILSPFANAEDASANIALYFAQIQYKLGNYVATTQYAKKALEKTPDNPNALYQLALGLEKQEKHAEAEKAFRDALAHWKEEPTSLMNDLALNLAAQKKIDESLDVLYQAKERAPHDTDVERNLRIIMALQQAKKGVIPKPKSKPLKG
ncbi:MAG: tetratricopeptide repeat protein [Alphaproteobacteria bacterium]|nr:tetratricopeptide repeat protein [Alphaproteobacteria bacterium]